MKPCIFSCLFLIIILPSRGWADRLEDKWRVDGELRLRYEIMDGFNAKAYGETVTPGESHDVFFLSRIRLGMTYSFKPDFLLKFSIQDARAFDWDFNDSDWYSREFAMENNPQKDQFELYHTYLQVSNINGLPLEMTIGRQRISYGDNRVFGPGEWGNSGKWIWDAVKFSFTRDEHFVDIFYGANTLHDINKFSLSHRWGYEALGIYGHYAWEKGGIEPILAYKHNDNGNASYQSLKHYYAGFRVYDDDVAGFFYNGTFIRQLGQQISVSGVKRDVDAYGWHLDTGYGVKILGEKAKIGAAFSCATGDDKSTQDIERFDGGFGAADNFYGRMNLMIWSNLEDAELFFIFTPIKNLKIKTEYHQFKVEDESDRWGQYENGELVNEDHLGDELDIVATYDHSKNIQFQTGYGHFRPGDFIRQNIPSGRGSDWFFFQTALTF
jgi:hypothetical protein